jgi:hypothetical protein
VGVVWPCAVCRWRFGVHAQQPLVGRTGNQATGGGVAITVWPWLTHLNNSKRISNGIHGQLLDNRGHMDHRGFCVAVCRMQVALSSAGLWLVSGNLQSVGDTVKYSVAIADPYRQLRTYCYKRCYMPSIHVRNGRLCGGNGTPITHHAADEECR